MLLSTTMLKAQDIFNAEDTLSDHLFKSVRAVLALLVGMIDIL